jgi:hypothetical protein
MQMIAKQDLGACSGCGLSMEAGEWVKLHPNGAIHVGCAPRASATLAARPTNSLLLFADPVQDQQPEVKQQIRATALKFSGESFSEERDRPRLIGQLGDVFDLMKDGQWRTLTEIATAAHCPEQSAGSRLRDFRKTMFGAHQVFRRPVEGRPGLYEYRLLPRGKVRSDGRIAV